MKKITITLGLMLCVSLSMFSQTAEEIAQITADYDLEKLKQIELNAQAEFEKRQERIREWAATSDLPLSKVTKDGSTQVIYDVINDRPIYRSTLNRNAGIMQGANALWNGGSLGLNVEGQNMTVGVWEIGLVQSSHEAFTGKLLVAQGASANNSNPTTSANHATHVTGTVLADGSNLNARGVAFRANGRSFNSDSDLSEMAQQASIGLLVSNHSYGIPADAFVTGAQLGRYSPTSRDLDQLHVNAPFFLSVWAAGNDRPAQVNTAKGGHDLLNNETVSKNNLVVGATQENLNYTGPTSTVMSSFSSWGPADDGRIKPDISTKGVQMLSSISGSTNSGYGFSQGTSMASPAVAGGILLLQQYYNSVNSSFMRSASVKGLALHTAKEAGSFEGPDYRFGWGTLDTEAAAIAIRDNGDNALIDELTLQNNATEVVTNVNANSSSRLIVSISWTDPASQNTVDQSNTSIVDPSTAMLVNDLDVVVTDASGTSFFPWKLDPTNPFLGATNTGTNDVDNYERVEIANPSGAYTITVSHKNNLTNGSQAYTLIVTGADQQTFSTSGPDSLDKLSIYPNPANDRFTVSFNNQLSGDSIHVNVFDVLGQLVISNKYDNTGVFEQTVDASTLNSGVYLVKVGNGVTSSTKKLIIR